MARYTSRLKRTRNKDLPAGFVKGTRRGKKIKTVMSDTVTPTKKVRGAVKIKAC